MEMSESSPLVLCDHYQDCQVDDTKELWYQFGLLEMIDGFRGPLYSYDKVTEFVYLASLYGVDLSKAPLTCDALLNNASKHLGIDGLCPYQ